MTNTFIDINVLQSVPTSNLNRDDTGAPKTAQYGGVTRSRVSSQSWKRAMREYFLQHSADKKLGVRTLNLVPLLVNKMHELKPDMDETEATKLATTTVKNAGFKLDKKTGKLKSLFFIGNEQATQLAQAALDGKNDKKDLKAILSHNSAIDIALFGRMLADDPTLNFDASSQVAHAISTHAVNNEFDFYTANDDFANGNQGAGMLGTMEYNSATLYRYANVAGHELVHQLGNTKEAAKALGLFIEAFIKSMPSGKLTSYANETLPSAVVITVRDDRPVSLVNGFEKPVEPEDGYIEPSIKRLNHEYDKANQFVDAPKLVLSLGDDKFDNAQNLNDLLTQFMEKVTPLLGE